MTGAPRAGRWPIVLVGALALAVGSGAGAAVHAVTTEPEIRTRTITKTVPEPVGRIPKACLDTLASADALAAQMKRFFGLAVEDAELSDEELGRRFMEPVQEAEKYRTLRRACRDATGKR